MSPHPTPQRSALGPGLLSLLLIPLAAGLAAALVVDDESFWPAAVAGSIVAGIGVTWTIAIAVTRILRGDGRARNYSAIALALAGGALSVASVPLFAFAGAVLKFGWTSGRPFRARGRAVRAPLGGRSDWAAPCETVRADPALAAAWLEDAAAEHASIAAFSRLSLELLSLGAPAALVEGAHRAALDEVQHARACFAQAAALGAGPQGPGAEQAFLETGGPVGLPELAAQSFVDGCVNETVASALAAAAAPRTNASRTLERIAEDERTHAELAWEILRWCRERGGIRVDQVLQAAARAVERQGTVAPAGVAAVILGPEGAERVARDAARTALERLDEALRPPLARTA